jgi:hypothetical protein
MSSCAHATQPVQLDPQLMGANHRMGRAVLRTGDVPPVAVPPVAVPPVAVPPVAVPPVAVPPVAVPPVAAPALAAPATRGYLQQRRVRTRQRPGSPLGMPLLATGGSADGRRSRHACRGASGRLVHFLNQRRCSRIRRASMLYLIDRYPVEMVLEGLERDGVV